MLCQLPVSSMDGFRAVQQGPSILAAPQGGETGAQRNLGIGQLRAVTAVVQFRAELHGALERR